jgi:hypothetical protein
MRTSIRLSFLPFRTRTSELKTWRFLGAPTVRPETYRAHHARSCLQSAAPTTEEKGKRLSTSILEFSHNSLPTAHLSIYKPIEFGRHALSIPTSTNPPQFRRCAHTLTGGPPGSSDGSHHRPAVYNATVGSSSFLCRFLLLGSCDTPRQTRLHLETWRTTTLS